MSKEELEKMLEKFTPKEIINKFINNELTLSESQINKLIKLKDNK